MSWFDRKVFETVEWIKQTRVFQYADAITRMLDNEEGSFDELVQQSAYEAKFGVLKEKEDDDVPDEYDPNLTEYVNDETMRHRNGPNNGEENV